MIEHTKATIWKRPQGDCFIVLSDPYERDYRGYKYAIVLGFGEIRELLIGVGDLPVNIREVELK